MKRIRQSLKKISLLIIFLLILSAPAPVLATWRVTSTGQLTSEGKVLGRTDNAGQAVSAEARDNAGRNSQPTTASQTDTTTDANAASDTDEESNDTPASNSRGNSDRTPPGLMGRDHLPFNTHNARNAKSVDIRPNENNRLDLRVQNQNNETDEATESDELVIEDDADKNVTKIRGRDRAAYVIRNRVAAQTNFPLQVNLETNELIVTTPAGTKTVTVLPDAAVENMLAANVLDQLGGKGGLRWLEEQATPSATPEATDSADIDNDDEATESGEVDEDDEATDSAEASPSATPAPTPTETTEPEVETEAETVIELVEDEDGTLTYRIEGVKKEKLLGFRDIDLNRVAVVSAETGELIRVEQDLYTTLLDWLSV